MPYNRRRAHRVGPVTLVVVAMVTAVTMRVPAAEAANDVPVIESIAFGLDGFQDLLLVEETDRLFVTGGADADTLVVTDLDGVEIARTTGLPGARQMAYDPTHNSVWVAVADDPGLRAFDAASGAATSTLMLPPTMCPSAVALAGGSDGTQGNELLVVASECDDRLVVVDLADGSWAAYSGFGGVIQVAPSPPPEQASRVVILDDTSVKIVNVQDSPPKVLSSVAMSASSLAASTSGARRIALGSSDGVEIWSYPGLEVTDEFALPRATVSVEWTTQPAVVAVNADKVVGLRPAAREPFWSFPVAPAIPLSNGVQAHSDGRLYIVAQLPDLGGDGGTGGGDDGGSGGSSGGTGGGDDGGSGGSSGGSGGGDDGGSGGSSGGTGGGDDGGSGGTTVGGTGGGSGGGIGVIIPEEGESPATLSGTIGAVAPAAPGHTPGTFEVRLIDAAGDLVAVDSVAPASASYAFTAVQPGDYSLEFWALEDGVIEGFFPERYGGLPLLSSAVSSIVQLDSGASVTIDADLRPLFYDMFDSVFRADILWMGSTGITKGCNPPLNTSYCPESNVTRGQMAAFLSRALNLPAGPGVDFVDDDGSVFEADIEKLAFAGITKGCNPPVNDRFCPDANVTRGQMAAFLNRADL